MLKNTFCHIPGIGVNKEQSLWDSGVRCWQDALDSTPLKLPRVNTNTITQYIQESFERLDERDLEYFNRLLPDNQNWRLFPDFSDAVAYLDIETTGLGFGDVITTIALYDGKTISWYVNGHNLDDFVEDIRRYSLLVTFNGKCFDLPFMEAYFGIEFPQAHIDLRYVLKSLGFKGGLKACEKRLGIDRGQLDGVDGFFAVLLWREYQRTGNVKALETLLAYNIQDVVNLETLLILAYNLKLHETPFTDSHHLTLPSAPLLPFVADSQTVARIRKENAWIGRNFYAWR